MRDALRGVRRGDRTRAPAASGSGRRDAGPWLSPDPFPRGGNPGSQRRSASLRCLRSSQKGQEFPAGVPDVTLVAPGQAHGPQRVEQRRDPAHRAQRHQHRGRRGASAEPGRGPRQQPPAAPLALRRQAVGLHVRPGEAGTRRAPGLGREGEGQRSSSACRGKLGRAVGQSRSRSRSALGGGAYVGGGASAERGGAWDPLPLEGGAGRGESRGYGFRQRGGPGSELAVMRGASLRAAGASRGARPASAPGPSGRGLRELGRQASRLCWAPRPSCARPFPKDLTRSVPGCWESAFRGSTGRSSWRPGTHCGGSARPGSPRGSSPGAAGLCPAFPVAGSLSPLLPAPFPRNCYPFRCRLKCHLSVKLSCLESGLDSQALLPPPPPSWPGP